MSCGRAESNCEAEIASLEFAYSRLRARRSVRFALRVADVLRPLFRSWRYLRERFTRIQRDASRPTTNCGNDASSIPSLEAKDLTTEDKQAVESAHDTHLDYMGHVIRAARTRV